MKMKKNDFTGIGTLLRLALKRDKTRLIVWMISVASMTAVIVAGNGQIASEERIQMASFAIINPGMRLLLAPIAYEYLGDLGPFFLMRMSFLLAIIVAIFSIQNVVRHTRKNEETGCAELIGANVTGRYASLTAALTAAAISSIGFGLMISLGMVINGIPAAGSLVAGLSYGALGMLFAGIAAVTSQFSGSSRGASGQASIVLAVFFMINASGNVLGNVNEGGFGFSGSFITWFSPVGWVQRINPFAENNSWIILLLLFVFALFVSLAYLLINKRDIGRGLFAEKKGKSNAAKWLQNPYGLVFRLQRGHLAAWAVPVFLIGLMFGAATETYGETMEGLEFLEQTFKATSEMFRYLLISIASMVLSIFAVSSIMKLRNEESGGPLESVLSTPVSRNHILSSYVLFAVLGSVILSVIFGFGVGISSTTSLTHAFEFVYAALLQSTGIIVISGIALAVYGLFPVKAKLLSWTAVTLSLITGPFIAPLINMNQSLRNLSPFSHIDIYPSEVSFLSVFLLLIIGITASIIGYTSFNRRDMSF